MFVWFPVLVRNHAFEFYHIESSQEYCMAEIPAPTKCRIFTIFHTTDPKLHIFPNILSMCINDRAIF